MGCKLWSVNDEVSEGVKYHSPMEVVILNIHGCMYLHNRIVTNTFTT